MIYDLYARRFIMPKSISISQLNQLMSTKPQPIIIDIREPYQFAGYHLCGAGSCPGVCLVLGAEGCGGGGTGCRKEEWVK